MLTSKDKKLMNTTINWQNEIETIAGPFRHCDTQESWLGRAHKRVIEINPKVTFRSVRRLFKGEIKDPKFSLAGSVLSAADQARIDAGKQEASQLATRFETIAGGLRASDENFHSDTIAALVGAARAIRSLDSA